MSSNIQDMRDQVKQLRMDIGRAKIEVAEFNRLFTTYLSLARKFGFPPHAMEFLVKIQQLRVAVQALHRSIMLLYTTTGPIGWLIGLGGLALSAFMMADVMEARRPQY